MTWKLRRSIETDGRAKTVLPFMRRGLFAKTPRAVSADRRVLLHPRRLVRRSERRQRRSKETRLVLLTLGEAQRVTAGIIGVGLNGRRASG
jgi:hypothetical protein